VKKILVKDITDTTTAIEVSNPAYLDEIGSWEGHTESLNIIKIGKELIYYKGISSNPPYTLQNVTRGYWGTEPSHHHAGDRVYKLQGCNWFRLRRSYPNIQLQDSIAAYYADMSYINGIYYQDWDGTGISF
jgi:hypothetical protein